MVRKLVALWSIIRTSTFVIITDTRSIVHIPDWIDPKDGDNMLWFLAQRSSIRQIIDDLEDAIKKHEKEVDKLSNNHKEEI